MLLIDAECIGADLIQSQVKSSQTMGAHDCIIMILLMLSFLLWFDVNTALIFEHNYEVDSWGSQLSLLFCSCYHFCWMTTQLWSSSTIMKSTHGAQCTAAPAVGYKWCKYHFKAGLYYKVTTENQCNCQNEKYSWNKSKIWSQQTLSELPLQRGKEMSLKKGVLMWRKLIIWIVHWAKIDEKEMSFYVAP